MFKTLLVALISLTYLGMWHCFDILFWHAWVEGLEAGITHFDGLILLNNFLVTTSIHVFPPKSLLNFTLLLLLSSLSLQDLPNPYHLTSVTFTRTVFVFLKWNKNALFFNNAIKTLQILTMPSSMFYLFVDKSDLLSEATQTDTLQEYSFLVVGCYSSKQANKKTTRISKD